MQTFIDTLFKERDSIQEFCIQNILLGDFPSVYLYIHIYRDIDILFKERGSIQGCCIQSILSKDFPASAYTYDDDDCFYYHSWRNNVVIAFGTLSSFLTLLQ